MAEPAMHPLAVAPFVVLLLGIATLPLLGPKWWEANRNKALFTGLASLPAAVIILTVEPSLLTHAGEEYASFMVLLGSLYITTGGIAVRGEIRPSPLANAAILGAGAVLASLIGTTGASMLLIRPFLRANQIRNETKHLPVFFIFCVSNAGGLLTPLGDPPLFLGLLRGVPFGWTFPHLLPAWLLVNGALIAAFFVLDWWQFRQGGGTLELPERPLSISGLFNLIPLAAIIVSAALLPPVWREGAMVTAAIASHIFTPAGVREDNGFTFHPIVEVAVLFFGIFLTMQPALQLLPSLGASLGVDQPAEFFWATGLLSSFLDNAPTYVTFFTIAQGITVEGATVVAGVPEPLLVAVSLGSVLMGANTYIGNGPNFMVKAIADEAGFKTPSFFGYLAWSGIILLPLWVVVDLFLI